MGLTERYTHLCRLSQAWVGKNKTVTLLKFYALCAGEFVGVFD